MVRRAPQPFSFLMLNNGSGITWKGNQEGYQVDDIEAVLKLINEVDFKKTEVQEGLKISKEIEDSDRQSNFRSPVRLRNQ